MEHEPPHSTGLLPLPADPDESEIPWLPVSCCPCPLQAPFPMRVRSLNRTIPGTWDSGAETPNVAVTAHTGVRTDIREWSPLCHVGSISSRTLAFSRIVTATVDVMHGICWAPC